MHGRERNGLPSTVVLIQGELVPAPLAGPVWAHLKCIKLTCLELDLAWPRLP